MTAADLLVPAGRARGLGRCRQGGDLARCVARAIGIGLVAALVVAGCSSGAGDGEAATGTDTPATDQSSSSGADGASGGSGLAARALTLDGLPDGWEEAPPTERTLGAMACFQLLDAPAVQERAVDHARRTFASARGIPALEQVVVQLASPADASEVMDDLVEQVEGCTAFRGMSPGSGPAPSSAPGPVTETGGVFDPVTVADIDGADRQLAWQLSPEATGGVPLSADVVVVQRGDVVSALLLVGIGADGTQPAVDLAAVATARLA